MLFSCGLDNLVDVAVEGIGREAPDGVDIIDIGPLKNFLARIFRAMVKVGVLACLHFWKFPYKNLAAAQ